MRAETGQMRTKREAINLNSNMDQETAKRIQKALSVFCSAAKGKDAGAVCESFEQLRKAARGINASALFKMADASLGTSALDRVIAAYANRECYMCEGGTIPCDHCHGTGIIARDKPCHYCNGAAIEACSFCAGTAWGHMQSVPEELLAAVRRRQLDDAMKDLKRLGAVASKLKPKIFAKLPQEKKTSLRSWMIRLQSRLAELSTIDIASEKEAAHIQSASKNIGRCLEMLI